MNSLTLIKQPLLCRLFILIFAGLWFIYVPVVKAQALQGAIYLNQYSATDPIFCSTPEADLPVHVQLDSSNSIDVTFSGGALARTCIFYGDPCHTVYSTTGGPNCAGNLNRSITIRFSKPVTTAVVRLISERDFDLFQATNELGQVECCSISNFEAEGIVGFFDNATPFTTLTITPQNLGIQFATWQWHIESLGFAVPNSCPQTDPSVCNLPQPVTTIDQKNSTDEYVPLPLSDFGSSPSSQSIDHKKNYDDNRSEELTHQMSNEQLEVGVFSFRSTNTQLRRK